MASVNYPDAPVDANGLVTHMHVARHHIHTDEGEGEVTLCGVALIYRTHRGFVPNPPMCDTCERLDV
jgi:hypothetical protein